MHQLDDLFGRVALARHLGLSDLPDLGDILAMLRVLDVAIAGELVALVAVFSPALSVPLPGDGPIPAAWTSEASGRQHQVDAGEHVLHALGVVLDAPRMHQKTGLGRSPQLRRLYNQGGIHPRQL